MKTYLTIKRTTILVALVFSFTGALAQSAPELVFRNPSLVSGTDGQDGAQYRFSNVTSGVDAVIEIKSRSAADVKVNNIDLNSSGWDKAFQPELGKTGIVGSLDTWWVKFKMVFYAAGTNNRVTVDKIVVTGLDIDGDGQSLSEYTEMDSVYHTDFSPTTMLTQKVLSTLLDPLLSMQPLSNLRIDGPVSNYTDIDTAATNVMVTYTFLKKSEINFKLGATNGIPNTNAGMRLNSFWFKEFNLTAHTLPVTLKDFSATLNNNRADLKWSTATESNVSHFMVEKSFDGKEFKDAALVFAYGNSTQERTYQFSDDLSNAPQGIVYYRLKMQDNDGSYTYSATRMIQLGKKSSSSLSLSVYPNPVTDEVKVTIPSSWQGNMVLYELYNTSGQKVFQQRNDYASQTERIGLNNYQRGIYIIRVSNGNESIQNKIIKN